MSGIDRNELHWHGQRTVYLCADVVEVSVRKRTFTLDKRYVTESDARYNYPYGNRGVYSSRTRYQITAPESGIVYKRGYRPSVVVSKTLFNRGAKALVKAVDHCRTYSIPSSVRNISHDAFYCNNTIRAVRLNKTMKRIDMDTLPSSLRIVILSTTIENLRESLIWNGQSRKALLPNGVWLTASAKGWGYSRQATMIVPPDVHEIEYLPVYKKICLSKVVILPGSNLEKIGERAFAGTDIYEFIAPPSLREIGIAAFLNCKYLTRVALDHTVKVGGLCFWGTQVE